jgi:predicted secreted protein
MWGFLTTLLPYFVACFFIGGPTEASHPVTIIGQKVDLKAKIVKGGQVVAAENSGNDLSRVASSSPDAGFEVKLNRGDNGKEITIKTGDVLEIKLERSGSTGYEWYLDETYKKYFELLREDTETRQSGSLVGTPVVRTWKLRATKRGETDIRLFLYREWEGRDKAVETFRIKVRIV